VLEMIRQRLESLLPSEKTSLLKTVSFVDSIEEFGFTIDGDYLVLNNGSVANFIEALEKPFSIMKREERTDYLF